MTPRLRSFLLCLVPAAALVGCGPIVQIGGNAKAPESLLTIASTATARAYAGPTRLADTLAVALPTVPATLQTLRLPVTGSASEVRYLAGATWAEQPNRQFQRLLADTITANGTPVLDARQPAVSPARLLSGTLRDFGLDISGAPQVRVRFDAQLAAPRAPDGRVGIRRFEASEPVADQSPPAVAAALNRAANRVAAEVADWVKAG
jgi:cholesterol transport system auxiliary component